MADEAQINILDALHDGIVARTRERFPALATVEAYRLDRKNLPVPACLVELTELEADADADPGTEQLAVTARFEARFVISFRQGGKNPKREVRKLAAAFAVFARHQRWGCPVGAAEVLGCYPDDFDPELDQYECWRVEWQQTVRLGESVWVDDGVTPGEVLLAWAPEIGAAHEAGYVPANEAPGARAGSGGVVTAPGVADAPGGPSVGTAGHP